MNTCGLALVQRALLSNFANIAASRVSRSLCFHRRLLSVSTRAHDNTMSPHQTRPDHLMEKGKHQMQYNISESAPVQGDLNNTSSMRQTEEIRANSDFAHQSLAMPIEEDESETANKYRPFLHNRAVAAEDWVSKLELATVTEMAHDDIAKTGQRLKVLVLYGSLRRRYGLTRWKSGVRIAPLFGLNTLAIKLTFYSSYSQLLAFEISRILWRLGCDVRVYDPSGLPMKDDVQHMHPKVQELRDLSRWSDGHFWISPEQHGNLVCEPYDPILFSYLSYH